VQTANSGTLTAAPTGTKGTGNKVNRIVVQTPLDPAAAVFASPRLLTDFALQFQQQQIVPPTLAPPAPSPRVAVVTPAPLPPYASIAAAGGAIEWYSTSTTAQFLALPAQRKAEAAPAGREAAPEQSPMRPSQELPQGPMEWEQLPVPRAVPPGLENDDAWPEATPLPLQDTSDLSLTTAVAVALIFSGMHCPHGLPDEADECSRRVHFKAAGRRRSA
jgi:hypothetical protein